MPPAPHAQLNAATKLGADEAARYLPALTRAYGRSLRAAGRRAAAAFRQTEPIRAAARQKPSPEWTPPPGSLVDAAALAADTQWKTGKIHKAMLAASAGEALRPFGISFDIRAPTSQALLDAVGQRIQDGIASAIQEQIGEAIRAGYANGDSVYKVSQAIQAATDAISRPRADMLARTDLNALSNGGSLLAASISGASETKTWLATMDDRTRDTHADADGQTVGINDVFDVGGESLMFPGDTAGSWEETANCFPAGTRVAGMAIAVMRSPYGGDLVKIETHRGRILTGTPNHPILTARGWVPLKFIEQGDYVVCASLDQGAMTGAADVDEMPSLIEDVWDALAVTGVLERIPAVDVNFHGDRADGDVEVVRTDRFLELPGTPTFLKPAQEFPLSVADELEILLADQGAHAEFVPANLRPASCGVGKTRQSAALVGSHASHADEIGFAAVSADHTFAGQSTLDDDARSSEGLSNFLLRHTAVVEPDRFVDIYGDAIGAARVNLAALEVVADCLTGNPELIRDLLVREPGGIEFDDVVSIETLSVAHGDVLTLETDRGYYIANGIVVKNCRCTLTYGEPLTASARVATPRDFTSWREGGWEGANDPLPIVAASNPSAGILYLARHALTAYDSDNHATDTIRGWADDPLTAEGEAEAARLADAVEGLGITSLATSDLQRAAKTARIISDRVYPIPYMTDALRPWNLGDLQGRTSEDAAGEIAGYCDRPNLCVPGGESFADFCSRFLPVVADAMASAKAGETPLLVTHSHNLKLARAWINGGRQPVTGEQFSEAAPGPASVLACVPEGDSWTVTEILCAGAPLEATGSVPPEAHYRPAADADTSCATCEFFSADYCSMFAAAVLPDYVCDEFAGRESATVTSGGDMDLKETFARQMQTALEDGRHFPGRTPVVRATELEMDAVRSIPNLSPLGAPGHTFLAALHTQLAARGADVYDDAELRAMILTFEALGFATHKHSYAGGICEICGVPEGDGGPMAALTDLSLTAAAGGTQWQATLCVAGMPTVDGGIKRLLEVGSGAWLPLPLPLALLDDSPHTQMTTKAPICGRIDQIWWAGDVCQGSGVFSDDSDDPAVAAAGSKAAALVGELLITGISIDLLPNFDVEMALWNGSSISALDVPNDPVASEMDGMPIMDDAAGDEENEENDDEGEAIYVLKNWTIAGATICPVQALTQARIGLVAAALSSVKTGRFALYVGETEWKPPLTASAAGLAPTKPPAEWFELPEADEPTPLTVTDEGQVYGHMALWNTCHTGFAGQCVPPPKSPSDYEGFHLGEIPLADGSRISVGTLTMDTGHAGRRLSAGAAVAHYDDTGTAAAYVRARDGRFGIWVAGTLSARLDAADAQALMAAKPSGDWREIFRGRGRDMLGALMVNVPGFVVPRTLTASGMPGGDVAVEFSSDCEPCEADYARELAVLAASADGIEGLAALVSG